MDKATVKEIRDALGLTQEEFAHDLGVSSITVSRWERGKVVPSRLAVRQLAEFARRAGVPYTQKAA